SRVANRERLRAQRQFNAVRTFAQSMLGEVHNSIQTLPGSTPAREILLRRGTEYLDALSSAGGDDDVRREVAIGYLQLSRVQGAQAAANPGARPAASRSRTKPQALPDPPAQRRGAAPEDRVRRAPALATRARIDHPQARDASLPQARPLLDPLSPTELASQ